MAAKYSTSVPVSPKIHPDAAHWIKHTFPTLNAGATFLLNSFPYIYRYSVAEIKEVFTPTELAGLLRLLSAHTSVLMSAYQYHSGILGHHVPLIIRETHKLNPNLFTHWGIPNAEELAERIANLPFCCRIVLEIWVTRYWLHLHEAISIDEYCLKTMIDDGLPIN